MRQINVSLKASAQVCRIFKNRLQLTFKHILSKLKEFFSHSHMGGREKRQICEEHLTERGRAETFLRSN